ncbi:MAG: hypothetical protein IPK97_11495 [Ahniella sp.]|nr:hypothetical protein [Ahniella sp.]
MSRSAPLPCPCGSPRYDTCCAPFHHGDALAGTAEQLMRARYSAYVMHQVPFLLASWHSSTRPSDTELMTADALALTWLGLSVKRHEQQGDTATVEFVARCRRGGTSAQRLHELSRFVREQGRWYYVDGDFLG